MTKREALEIFMLEILPGLPSRDIPARREAWNNFTDSLAKDGQITERQYATWLGPF